LFIFFLRLQTPFDLGSRNADFGLKKNSTVNQHIVFRSMNHKHNRPDQLLNPVSNIQHRASSIKPFDLGSRIADFGLKKNSTVNQHIVFRSMNHKHNRPDQLLNPVSNIQHRASSIKPFDLGFRNADFGLKKQNGQSTHCLEID